MQEFCSMSIGKHFTGVLSHGCREMHITVIQQPESIRHGLWEFCCLGVGICSVRAVYNLIVGDAGKAVLLAGCTERLFTGVLQPECRRLSLPDFCRF